MGRGCLELVYRTALVDNLIREVDNALLMVDVARGRTHEDGVISLVLICHVLDSYAL